MNCRITILIISLFLFCGINQELLGQTNLNFDVLSIDDGFSSSRANAIIQDKAGFIWVGTWNGLNRYDGYECVVFQSDNRDSMTLSNREVTALIEDHLGNIWIGTTFGLNRYNPVLNELQKYAFETRILSLFEDHKNNIWVGTAGDGLFCLNPATGQKHHFLVDENINFIYEDSRNDFWLATDHGPINFDRETSGYKRYLSNNEMQRPDGTHALPSQCIAESSAGVLWMGLGAEGLLKIIPNVDEDSIKFFHYQPNERIGGLCNYPVDHLCFDKQDNLWIGTRGGGLYLLTNEEQDKHPEVATFNAFRYDVNDQFSFAGDNIITALFVDHTETLWVGSSFINIAKIGNRSIVRYNTRQIEDGEVIGNWVRDIESDRKGKYWMGTNDGLISYNFREHPVKKKISHFYNCNGDIHKWSSVLAVLPDRKGNLWVGTNSEGLFIVPQNFTNNEQIKVEDFFNQETPLSLPDNSISVLAASLADPNVTWIGTGQGGFIKCTTTNGKYSFEKYTAGPGNKFLTDNHIRSILEDKQGLVWIGTQFGLNCFDPTSGNFDHYYFSITDTSSINDNVINVLFEDSNDDLWIGTNAGLNKKIEEQNEDGTNSVTFRSYTSPLVDNEIIINILEDDHKNLWVGIYNGIVKFNIEREDVEFEFFDKAYSRIKIDQDACWKDTEGRFILGGGSGFLSFHPDSIQKESTPPMIQITDLLLFNEKATVGRKGARKKILKKSISNTDSLIFTHKLGVFTFVFSSMEYFSPNEHKYAYLLEGYDKGWNYVGTRNTATYTNIPHGNYVFKVKACDSHGSWSTRPKQIYLTIKPPFWKTYWAYFIYGCLIVGILYFFKRFSIIQIKEKSQLMLEKIQYEKEHELNELKVHFFTNITHEFRTPLTLILGPLQEMLDQKGKLGVFSRNLELIQRNANRLLRLINQLMEFRKVEKGKVELLLQEVDVVPILIEMYDTFKSLADSKKIDFNLQYSQPSIHAWLDRDKFDKVMFNLLSNAFKFTDEGGKIVIRAGFDSNPGLSGSFYIEIEDTGIGIPKEKKELVFERFYQINQKGSQSTGGIGLYLSKTFIELHYGTIQLESEFGKGSCFRILIPVNLNIASPTSDQDNLAIHVQNEFEPIQHKDAEIEDYIFAIDDGKSPDEINLQSSGTKSRPYILFVEDDLDMNEFVSKSLAVHFKIKSTFNGKEALEIARRSDPDLILSDIMMPEMDGLELGRLLQEDINTSHIPILFLTAKTTRENELEGLQIGAVDYICKPFSVSSLHLKIVNILKNRDLMHERFQKNHLLDPQVEQLSSLDEQFLKDAMEALQQNLDNSNFDVELLSKKIGLSSNQTYRKIKALTGQTAKEFIRTQRLKIAAKLLLQKKRSVSEIIYMVGFSNPSYFSRCFREHYGCSPSEYIEKNGNV